MTSKTTVQYTPEQTETLVAGYAAGETVEALAIQLGKSTRSVIAKLSREGVYQSKVETSTPTIRKGDLIQALATKHGVPLATLESLEKATRGALEALLK